MSVHPLAGKPPPPELLVDVAELVAAYYERRPNAGDRDERVAFGTSGHRGSSIRGTFNEAHVLAITRAVAEYRRQQGITGPLFLGRDTHALSEPAFRSALEVLAADGVDVMIDGQGRIFLVKHSYIDGWHLPGGGVEQGETIGEALARELAEEGNIRLTGAPRLHGLYFNKRTSRRDHVALFIVREFIQERQPVPNREIIEHGFFAREALPEDTGRATRARIAEVFEGAAVSELW